MLDRLTEIPIYYVVIGPIVLAAAMIYGTLMWHRRRKTLYDPTVSEQQNIEERRTTPGHAEIDRKIAEGRIGR
jgi:hypothetical protein